MGKEFVAMRPMTRIGFRAASAAAFASMMLVGACDDSGPDIPRPEVDETELEDARAKLDHEWVPPPAGWQSYAEQAGSLIRVIPRMRSASAQMCFEGRFEHLGSAEDCTANLNRWLDNVQLNFGEDDANASVSPDGEIVFNSGLLKAAANDDEVAYVLGHEMAHGFAGHFEKRQQGAMQGAVVGGVVASGLAAILCPECTQQTISDMTATGMQAGAVAGAVQYSPERELEADEYAILLASYAGYDPRAGRALIIRLSRGLEGEEVVTGLSQVSFRSYFNTHPSDEHRLAHFDEIIWKYGL